MISPYLVRTFLDYEAADGPSKRFPDFDRALGKFRGTRREAGGAHYSAERGLGNKP